MITILRTEAFRLFAQIARYAPKGRARLVMFFLKLASTSEATPSIYGPWLQSEWHDLTFRFCVAGYYGHYFSGFLRKISFPFSLVDIGANYGIYSLIAAENSQCEHCYAFEPNSKVFEVLKRNIELNKAAQIQAFNFAISDQVGLLPFAVSTDHSGVGNLSADQDSEYKVLTRDSKIFDQIESVDKLPKVVKIDVEGHEPIVIHELMNSTLWNSVRYLFFESNDARYDAAKLIAELKTQGFENVFRVEQGADSNLMFER